MKLLLIIAAETILASALTAVLFGWDKRVAITNGEKDPGDRAAGPRSASRGGRSKTRNRVPERTLLIASALGGWPGGWWAGRRFRHKTQKTRFRISFFFAAAIHVAGVAAIVFWMLKNDRIRVWSCVGLSAGVIGL